MQNNKELLPSPLSTHKGLWKADVASLKESPTRKERKQEQQLGHSYICMTFTTESFLILKEQMSIPDTYSFTVSRIITETQQPTDNSFFILCDQEREGTIKVEGQNESFVMVYQKYLPSIPMPAHQQICK